MNPEHDSPWKPPEDPSPSEILNEAVKNCRNGRYEIALQKHCWYHQNALDVEPSQYGVRISFALGYWRDLAELYPPAMAKLLSFRDRAAQNVHAGIDVHASFHDAKSINRILGDSEATLNLFLQIHQNDQATAKSVYHLAQPNLIAAGEYDLCCHYLNAEAAIDRAIERLSLERNLSLPEPNATRTREILEKQFRIEAATIIALLVVVDRMEEAEELANRIIGYWDDPSVRTAIDHALKGRLPSQNV